MKKFFLFLDESGDHGLVNIDHNFPVFVLNGIIINEENYVALIKNVKQLKAEIWGDKKVILHSRDIRKCEKEFSVLFDLEIKKSFYEKLNSILRNTDYSIISSAIKKDKYVRKFGKLVDDVYEVSLSSIIERAIYYLMEKEASPKSLNIKIEKRGKKEDRKLKNHFFILRDRGSSFITAEKIKNYYSEIEFIDKKDDIVGLQISDLVAYPIARYIIDPKRANPAFEVISNKLFIQNKKRYGIKIFP